jgi:hypothetical protein
MRSRGVFWVLPRALGDSAPTVVNVKIATDSPTRLREPLLKCREGPAQPPRAFSRRTVTASHTRPQRPTHALLGAAAIATPVELTVILGQNAPTEDQSANSRSIESATSHGPCASRSRAHIRVFACRRAAVDSETTRGLRTGCDAPLQSVYPGRSACQRLHVSLPSLP